MTEKKYTLEYESEEICQVAYDGNYIGVDEVVDRLNGLTAQNSVLYKEIERLKRKNESILYSNAVNKSELEKENKELKDKNSQLQETLAFRSNQLSLMERLVDDLGSAEMARQMEEILE